MSERTLRKKTILASSPRARQVNNGWTRLRNVLNINGVTPPSRSLESKFHCPPELFCITPRVLTLSPKAQDKCCVGNTKDHISRKKNASLSSSSTFKGVFRALEKWVKDSRYQILVFDCGLGLYEYQRHLTAQSKSNSSVLVGRIVDLPSNVHGSCLPAIQTIRAACSSVKAWNSADRQNIAVILAPSMLQISVLVACYLASVGEARDCNAGIAQFYHMLCRHKKEEAGKRWSSWLSLKSGIKRYYNNSDNPQNRNGIHSIEEYGLKGLSVASALPSMKRLLNTFTELNERDANLSNCKVSSIEESSQDKNNTSGINNSWKPGKSISTHSFNRCNQYVVIRSIRIYGKPILKLKNDLSRQRKSRHIYQKFNPYISVVDDSNIQLYSSLVGGGGMNVTLGDDGFIQFQPNIKVNREFSLQVYQIPKNGSGTSLFTFTLYSDVMIPEQNTHHRTITTNRSDDEKNELQSIICLRRCDIDEIVNDKRFPETFAIEIIFGTHPKYVYENSKQYSDYRVEPLATMLDTIHIKCTACGNLFLPRCDTTSMKCPNISCQAVIDIPIGGRRGSCSLAVLVNADKMSDLVCDDANNDNIIDKNDKELALYKDYGCFPRYKPGDKVRALWLGEDRHIYPDWYGATVTAVHIQDSESDIYNTCRINCDAKMSTDAIEHRNKTHNPVFLYSLLYDDGYKSQKIPLEALKKPLICSISDLEIIFKEMPVSVLKQFLRMSHAEGHSKRRLINTLLDFAKECDIQPEAEPLAALQEEWERRKKWKIRQRSSRYFNKYSNNLFFQHSFQNAICKPEINSKVMTSMGVGTLLKTRDIATIDNVCTYVVQFDWGMVYSRAILCVNNSCTVCKKKSICSEQIDMENLYSSSDYDSELECNPRKSMPRDNGMQSNDELIGDQILSDEEIAWRITSSENLPVLPTCMFSINASADRSVRQNNTLSPLEVHVETQNPTIHRVHRERSESRTMSELVAAQRSLGVNNTDNMSIEDLMSLFSSVEIARSRSSIESNEQINSLSHSTSTNISLDSPPGLSQSLPTRNRAHTGNRGRLRADSFESTCGDLAHRGQLLREVAAIERMRQRRVAHQNFQQLASRRSISDPMFAPLPSQVYNLHGPKAGDGAPRDLILQLPSFKYQLTVNSTNPTVLDDETKTVSGKLSNSNSFKNVDQCMICMCDFKVGDALRMLPCMHKYHIACIDRWLNMKPNCPICHNDAFK